MVGKTIVLKTNFPTPFLIIFLLSFLCQVTFLGKSYALTQGELAKYREEAKSSARGMKPDVDSYFNDVKKTQEIKKVSGHETDTPYGADMSITEAESLGSKAQEAGAGVDNYKYQCTKKKCEVGETLSSQGMLNRQEKIDDAMVMRDKDGNIIGHKAFVDNIIANQKESEVAFATTINGSQDTCAPTVETFTKTTPDTCDSYYDYTESSCYPKQVVEIDPKFNYSCNKKREIKTKVCEDVITSISCKDNSECAMGGIKPKSIDSDISFWFENGRLLMGKQDYAGWSGHCTSYNNKASFELKNIDKIKEFTLSFVRFDDYIEVDLNGQIVYAGPDAGATKAEVINNSYVDDGTGGRKSCERDSDRHINLNINLIPYLKEGLNTIRYKVIVSGVGTGSLVIKAKQVCCNDWNIKREERCDYR